MFEFIDAAAEKIYRLPKIFRRRPEAPAPNNLKKYPDRFPIWRS
jgi:hypothetical protein